MTVCFQFVSPRQKETATPFLQTQTAFLLTVFIVIAMNAPPVKAQATATRPPNIVFVITDDQGYGDLSCTGNPVVRTPHIDRFHDQAVRFTNFHVGPTCAPTRAGLLTGHYAGSTGVWHTIAGRSIVREPEWMLPEALRAAGYRTAMFGKWHLGDNFPYRPQDRGFETVIHHPAGGIGQQPDYWGNDYFDDTYFVNGEPTAFEGYCTDVWFDQAGRFIQEHVESRPDQPFFCYLAPNAPHAPYNVPSEYSEKYRGKVPPHVARFYGMIDNIDENFAKLRALLQRLSIEDNTIVIFMTDNGSSCPMVDRETGFPEEGFNAGLRYGKGSPYDGGHRVPVFVRWPEGGIGGGRDVDTITANIDMMPTLLDLCGIPPRKGHTFHGQSLRKLMLNGDDPQGEDSRVIVTESQRVLTPVKWRNSCVMTDRWRLIKGDELYDMTVDRVQANNVADEHPGVVERLRAEYEAWWAMVYADVELPVPLPLGDPDGPETVQLNSHDWRYPEGQNDVVWNQKQVRQGALMRGHWEIDVRHAGVYRIELRRWAREDREHVGSAGAPVNTPLAWDQTATDPDYAEWYSGDNEVDIRAASLEVGRQCLEKALSTGETAATFELELPRGPAHLRANFTTADGETFGAYYVYATRMPAAASNAEN